MFLAIVSHIFRSALTVYTAVWNTVPMVLSAADRRHRSAADRTVGTVFQKAVYTAKALLKMGETVAQNMQNKIKRTNKTNFAESCWLLIT